MDHDETNRSGPPAEDSPAATGQPIPPTPDFGGVDPRLGTYLWDVLQWGGSDLHITSGRPPMVRIDGTLRRRDQTAALHDDLIFTMLRSTMDDEVWETFERRRQVDYSLALGDLGRFRVNAYHQLGSPAAAFRAISPRVPTLAEIGVPPEVSRMTEFPYGLVLFVGPTGSGKSTTQAALVGKINAERPCHILTIEDPVEYLHGHGVAMVNQREVGNDVHSFADGLRSALREDPDIILLGEMRDEESISITLTLAETGHLVFATLHTNDASQAIDRIIDSYPAERRDQIQTQLSAALQGVVSQRLVPRIGSGRAVACEVMVANEAVRNLIREGKTRQLRNVISTASTEGMRTMESSLDALVQGGAVAYEEAIAISQYPKEIRHPALSAGIAEAQARLAGRS
jgi:twitching motility protein PilT